MNATRRTSSRLHLSLLCVAVAAMLSLAAVAEGCPKCRESLPNGQQQAGQVSEPNVAQGYAWSIYLMIAIPFLMVATLGGTAFVLIRKASTPPLAASRRAPENLPPQV